MADAVKLVYHQATFDLLGEEPVVSVTALKEIEAWERRYRAKLPAAVREWYALEKTMKCCRLGQPFSEPPPVLLRLDDFPKFHSSRPAGVPRRLSFAFGSLLSAYLSLDGSEDPPVTNYKGNTIRCQTFSRFIFEGVWDRLTSQWALSVLLTQQEPAFGPAPLDFLTERFEEAPRQDSSQGGCKFRFYRPCLWVYVIAVGDPTSTECQAAWRVAAESEEELLRVLREVRPFFSTGATCSANGSRAEAVVELLREESHEPFLWRPEGGIKR